MSRNVCLYAVNDNEMLYKHESNIYNANGLVHYNTAGFERDQLEIIEEKANIQFISGIYHHNRCKISQEFTIKNREETECVIEIGFFVEDDNIDFPMPIGIQFFVDNAEYKYTVKLHELLRQDDGKLWEKSYKVNGNLVPIFVNWAVIEVVFPPNTEKIIQAQYTNNGNPDGGSGISGAGRIMYNKFRDNFSIYTKWNGSPKFSVIIENYSLENNTFERNWISDIIFYKKVTERNNHPETERLCFMLMNMNVPNNDLFSIEKFSQNTWEINFTEKFLDQFERIFDIYSFQWGGELGAYCLSYPSQFYPNIVESRGNVLLLQIFFVYHYNISDSIISGREIAPYELIFLTDKQLRIMRNAFYARHGYIFKDEDLQNLFLEYANDGFNYRENPDFSESMLTEIDRANIATIQRLEAMEYE
jgi:hypothetical protein